MSVHRLFSMMPPELAETRRPVVARWTETPPHGDWEAEPGYGAFVDEEGWVIQGCSRPRAFLASTDPRDLVLEPSQAPEGVERTVVFLDWGRQPLTWEEVFDLWEVWEFQNMIADCGSVAVPWQLSDRWTAPGWVAFRGDFDGSPLAVVPQRVAETKPEPLSFLARARKLREEASSAPAEAELPVLPFTLEALKDPDHAWPSGAA